MTTTQLHTLQRAPQNLQTSIISQKISALNLTHIESIARTLIGHILPNLGHVGCANVMEKFLEKKTEIIFDERQLEHFHCRRLTAEHARLIGKSDFCTPKNEDLFTEKMLPFFMLALKRSFQNSRNFEANGLTLKLSDASSEGFIYTEGKKLENEINDPSDFEITTFHIPPLYIMSLRIDRIFIKEQASLFVFTLAESVEGVSFSNLILEKLFLW